MRALLTPLLLGALLAASVNTGALAQNAGAFDNSFDSDGRLDIKMVNGNTDSAQFIINYPGRRLLAAARCGDSSGPTACLTRFNEDGSPDTSFGAGGTVVGQLIAGHRITLTGVALQSDGKILVSGRCDAIGGNSQPCHARLLANGQLDTAYGSNGGVVATLDGGSGYGSAAGIAVQSDGKIVIGGHCIETAYSLCAFRYDSNGTPDVGYGSGGMARATVTPNSFGSNTLLLTPDNQAIVVGYCDYGSSSSTANICLVRFTTAGVRDNAYVGGSGAPVLPHHTSGSVYESANVAVLQADGSAVLAGYCGQGSSMQMCAVRVTAGGMLDMSFGGGWNKPSLAALGAISEATGIALQRDGKILLTIGCVDRFKVCALRLNTDGSPDAGYGTAGVAAVTTSGYSTDVGGAVLDADERLLIAGGCYGNDGGGITDSCFWRLQRGSSYAARSCSFDIDDDGVALSANDVLIMTRAAMGFSGSTVLAGVTFAPGARRTGWTAMRDYLFNQCGMRLLR